MDESKLIDILKAYLEWAHAYHTECDPYELMVDVTHSIAALSTMPANFGAAVTATTADKERPLDNSVEYPS